MGGGGGGEYHALHFYIFFHSRLLEDLTNILWFRARLLAGGHSHSSPTEQVLPACSLGRGEVGRGCSAAGARQMRGRSRAKAEAATAWAAFPPPPANQSRGALPLGRGTSAAPPPSIKSPLGVTRLGGGRSLTQPRVPWLGHSARRMARWTGRAGRGAEPSGSPGAGLPVPPHPQQRGSGTRAWKPRISSSVVRN